MNSEKTMISLEELAIYFLKKWKMVAAIIITCVVVITGAVWLFFEKKYVETDFLYRHYEALVNEEEDYQNNSPIMKMDYNQVHKKYIDLSNVSDGEAVKQYVLSEDLWTSFPTDSSLSYLAELVSCSETDGNTVKLIVRYPAEQETDCVEYLVEQIKKFDSGIQLDVSEEIIEYDAEIHNKQIEHITLYRHYTEQMKISRVGYVQETAVTSAIVFAAVLGVILSISVVLSQFLKNKQLCEEETK